MTDAILQHSDQPATSGPPGVRPTGKRPAPPGHPPAEQPPGLTTRVATRSMEHPVLAIGAWILLSLVCIVGGNLAGMHKASSAQLTPGEAGRAAAMTKAAGLTGHDVESVLVTAKSGGVLDQAVLRDVPIAVRAAVSSLPDVIGVAPAVVSADRRAVLLQVTMADQAQDAQPLQAAVSRLSPALPSLQLDVTGSLAVNGDVNGQLASDFSAALVRSLPITIVILLLAFGALIAAGVPVVLGVTSVLSAVGLYTVASHVVPDGGTAAEMILLIGMAVGVDYSLFYLKREREERRLGRTGRDALLTAAATAGHAVVTSGCAVMVAMAGLFLLGDVNFASMAVGSIIVVALAVLGSLTVLPAILGLLGERVDRPRIPILTRLALSGRPARLWPMLLRPALRFPALTLGIGVGGMLLLAWPATGLHLTNSTEADLPQGLPSVAGYNRLVEAFPGQRSGLAVVVSGDPAQVASVAARLRSASADIGGAGTRPTVTGTATSADGGTTVVSLAVPFPADSPQASAVLTALRSDVVPTALGGQAGVQVAIGGSIASNADYLHELSAGAPWVIAFVLLLTFLLMALAFRSVVVGLVTIASNILSAGAAFGVLALVFQSRWGADLLGFHLSGAVIAWIPVFLFVILFGLSMDYHVLVISRIKEATDRGLPIREAVREGVSTSASVITSAAAVMIGVFAIFAGLHLVEFKELGVGLGVAVFPDAIVVRILILPALMSLLGRANWWAPRFLSSRGNVVVPTADPWSDGTEPESRVTDPHSPFVTPSGRLGR